MKKTKPVDKKQEIQQMKNTVVDALEDAKGVNIHVMDVTKITDITDYMVVVSGNSERHLKTLAEQVTSKMSEQSWRPLGVEGEQGGDWILVDFIDVVVHIMRESTRRHYSLEELWNPSFATKEDAISTISRN